MNLLLRAGLGIGFVLLIAGCGDKIAPGNTAAKAPLIKVPVAVAQNEMRSVDYQAAGTVQASSAGTVGAKMMGAIQTFHVNEGDRVKAGDLLVTIDDRQVKAQQQQAEAAYAAARKAEASAAAAAAAAAAGAELARSTSARYQQLIQDQSVTRQELDEVAARSRQAEAGLAQAQAAAAASRHRVEQAEAALAAARIAGADARVVAPYDGVVIARLAEAGDLATPGRPLVSMARTGALRVDLTVPETHAGVVGVGDKVTVAIDAIGGQRLQARISAVAPASNPASRSFLAKAELNGVDHLQPGMFARVFIPLGRNEVLLIPTSAVVNQGQLAGVFVVDQDNTARLRVIRTGQRFGDRVEVLSGLAEGERFVSTVSPALVDGARVEVGS